QKFCISSVDGHRPHSFRAGGGGASAGDARARNGEPRVGGCTNRKSKKARFFTVGKELSRAGAGETAISGCRAGGALSPHGHSISQRLSEFQATPRHACAERRTDVHHEDPLRREAAEAAQSSTTRSRRERTRRRARASDTKRRSCVSSSNSPWSRNAIIWK